MRVPMSPCSEGSIRDAAAPGTDRRSPSTLPLRFLKTGANLCGPRAPPNWEHIRGSGWTRTRGRKSPRRPRSVPPSPATLRIRDRAVLWTRLQRTPITTFLSRVICAAHGHRPSGTSRFQPPSTRYHPVIVEAVTSPHGVDVSQEPVQSTGPSGPRSQAKDQ